MAITRAQQAKQMLQDGGRIGLRLGNRGPGQASREAREQRDARDSAMGMGGKQRSGPSAPTGGGEGDRNPMAQFTPEAEKIAREMRNATMGAGDRFVPDIFPTTQGLANIFQVKKPTPFDLQRRGFIKTLGPQAVDMSEGDASQDIPYWAQLGFSSEAEYLASLQAQAPIIEEEEPEKDEGLRLAFRADGGPIGGEFDFESARQMYGLGKLVKKVGRTVKKIAKSPIGKAAITAAAIKFGGPLAAKAFPSTFGTTASSPFLRAVGRGQFFTNQAGIPGIFRTAGEGLGILGRKVGSGKNVDFVREGIFSNLGVGSAIFGASALAGLLTPKQEQQAQLLAEEEGIDIGAARRSILNAGTSQDFRALAFRAEGGPAEGKEPVAKKTMPLLDMGGQEMDLRAEGGFVPIGRMEKADDVPARLSKNEFVFTADAVRNAGDGSVDKGAEVMYNMMKNLEAGGDVSEESQGLKGARKMFQTSQRLEEVL